jgi:hypothetical protein
MTSIRDLVHKYDPKTLHIKQEFDIFDLSYNKEDESFKVVLKSDISKKKHEADHLRDVTFRGLRDAVKTALHFHFDPQALEAAERLTILLHTYKGLPDWTLEGETAGIHNLVQELVGKYAGDVALLRIDRWVSELDANNQSYDALSKAYTTQVSERTPFRMHEVRKETDKAYKAMIERVNAGIIVEGEGDYTAFVQEVNTLVKEYNDILAQQQGRRAKKKEEE